MYKAFIYRFLAILLVILSISGILLSFIPGLIKFSLVSLVLGLRHGLDSDHIVIIDNITRKLVNNKQSGASTGLYFALGHSTIVLCLTLLVFLGIKQSAWLYKVFAGNSLGAIISIVFLLLTAVFNLVLFKNLICNKNSALNTILGKKKIFNLIDKPYKMFAVGLMFALSFDTASEIGLLSIAAISATHGFKITAILLLPILFACGMIFTDTVNSILMGNIYNMMKFNEQKLFKYNCVIIGFSTLVTFIVLFIEIAKLVQEYLGSYALNIISILENNNQIFGICILFIFIIIWLYYKVKIIIN